MVQFGVPPVRTFYPAEYMGGDLLSAVCSIDGALLEVTTRFPLKKRHGTTRTIPLPSSLQGLQLLHSQPSLTSPAIIYQPQELDLWMKSEGA